MDSISSSSTTTTTTTTAAAVVNEKEAMVDPFLVEALQNPRHRLTILRMELDIQRFLQNPDQHHFEFQQFPTSYLRLAAHRVSQHYGLATMVQENGIEGVVNRILVRKTAESKYPAVRLSEILAKQSEESEKLEKIKISIRPRPNAGFVNEATEAGMKQSQVRSVEEREEEYDRARARIFSSPDGPNSEDAFTQVTTDGKNVGLNRDENEGGRNSFTDAEKIFSIRDGGTSSRIAIFRDREKDRTDPDYDRSYERYVRSLPANQGFSLAPFNMQKVQLPFMQYDIGLPQLVQIPRTQASLSYRHPPTLVMSPYCAVGPNQTSMEAAYMQLPSAAMMYAHSYEQFRHASFQVAFCQQPLNFDYSQNHS